MSVRSAAQHIQHRYMTRLKNAPFPVDVEGVGGMGTCAACPKRTGNAPDLYADVDDPDVCTDPDCFAIKRTAEAVRQAADLGDKVPVLTGIEAQQAMPTYYTETRSHARLDDICTNDPERRTYREIMGDDTEGVSLVQHDEKFIPIVQKKVITEKLRQEGAVTESQKQRAEARKEKQKLEIANVWRDRVFRLTRDLAAAEVAEDGIGALLPDVMPIIAHTFLKLAGYDKGGQVAGLWGALGMDNYTRQQAYLLQLPTLKPEELLLICLDLALIGDCRTDNYNAAPELLLTVARALEVDPDAELQKVRLEFAEAEGKKKGKAAKNRPAPSPTESTSTPQTAALAGNNTEGESATVEEQNSAPPETASGQPREEEQSSAADAAVEKQSGDDQFFSAGDQVIVLNSACMNGKVGVVSYIDPADTPYPCVVLIDGDEHCFQYRQLGLVEKAPSPAGAVIETDAKPSEDSGLSPKVGECIKVRSTAKNWKISGQLAMVLSTPKSDRPSYIVKFGESAGDMGEISQEEIVEIVGKPVLAWMKDPVDAPEPFKVGDRVKVKDDAKGASGIKRKCAGKEGDIEAVRGDIFAVRFAPGRNGVVAGLQADELIKVQALQFSDSPALKAAAPSPAFLVKYRHPEFPDLSWSGRGKKPKWVEAWLQTAGQTLEQLLPAEQAQGAEA